MQGRLYLPPLLHFATHTLTQTLTERTDRQTADTPAFCHTHTLTQPRQKKS